MQSLIFSNTFPKTHCKNSNFFTNNGEDVLIALALDEANSNSRISYNVAANWNGAGPGRTDLDDQVYEVGNGTTLSKLSDRDPTQRGRQSGIVLHEVQDSLSIARCQLLSTFNSERPSRTKAMLGTQHLRSAF